MIIIPNSPFTILSIYQIETSDYEKTICFHPGSCKIPISNVCENDCANYLVFSCLSSGFLLFLRKNTKG